MVGGKIGSIGSWGISQASGALTLTLAIQEGPVVGKIELDVEEAALFTALIAKYSSNTILADMLKAAQAALVPAAPEAPAPAPSAPSA